MARFLVLIAPHKALFFFFGRLSPTTAKQSLQAWLGYRVSAAVMSCRAKATLAFIYGPMTGKEGLDAMG